MDYFKIAKMQVSYLRSGFMSVVVHKFFFYTEATQLNLDISFDAYTEPVYGKLLLNSVQRMLVKGLRFIDLLILM